MNQEIEKVEQSQNQLQRNPSIFSDIKTFENAQRMVKPLACSQLVPKQYFGKMEDCLIALEMALRINASPLAVLQNLYIVNGKPAWSSQFLIATINASGKFSPLRYKMVGERGKDNFGCIAWAKDRTFGDELESPAVTIEMAKKEGWFTRNGSKWQSMPELMLRYRAATMFARTYCPELTMGIKTDDEVIDVAPVVTESPLENKSRFEKTPKREKSKPAAPAVVVITENSAVEPEHPESIPCTPSQSPEQTPLFADDTDLQINTWLHDNEPSVTLGQVKARCGHDNIPYNDSMLENDAMGLQMVVKMIKG